MENALVKREFSGERTTYSHYSNIWGVRDSEYAMEKAMNDLQRLDMGS